MNNSNLIEGKIYKGFYVKNDKNYFCYFVIDETKTQAVDIFTNERFKIYNFTSIEYECDQSELKHLRKIYKNNKNSEIFVQKNSEDAFINYNFNRILRFFELLDYSDIFKDDIDQKTLNNVILKIQNYVKRHIGIIESIEYTKQLKKAKTILEVLTFIPKELIDKNKIPFWIDILKQNTNKFIPAYYQPMNKILEYNKYDLNIFVNHTDRNLHKSIIEEKIENIKNNENFVYENKCKNKIFERIKEARITLENELIIANNTNDEDLIFEINIIKEELEKIENQVDNINFYDAVIEWWPDLLYPVPLIPAFERDEQTLFDLNVLTTDCASIL